MEFVLETSCVRIRISYMILMTEERCLLYELRTREDERLKYIRIGRSHSILSFDHYLLCDFALKHIFGSDRSLIV